MLRASSVMQSFIITEAEVLNTRGHSQISSQIHIDLDSFVASKRSVENKYNH